MFRLSAVLARRLGEAGGGLFLPTREAYVETLLPVVPAAAAAGYGDKELPCGLETYSSETAVTRWHRTVWNQYCILYVFGGGGLESEGKRAFIVDKGGIQKRSALLLLLGTGARNSGWCSLQYLYVPYMSPSCCRTRATGGEHVRRCHPLVVELEQVVNMFAVSICWMTYQQKASLMPHKSTHS